MAKATNSTNKQQTEIYMPEIITENPVDIEVEEKGYASLLQSAQEGGMIPVKLEEAVVRDRVSHDLYKNASSGLRELFANEAKACRTARNEYGARPRIEVTINNIYKKITIQGFDSLGIDQQLFVDVVRYLGRSSNFSGKETGQFGFGLASYTCLSDIMILETYSRKTEEKYAVMGKSGVGFQVLPKPKIDSYGTRITMTIKENVRIYELIQSLKKFVRFSGVETTLIVEDEDGVNSIESGIFELELETFEEALGKITNSDNYKTKIATIPIKIREDDFELYGNMVVDSWRWGASVEDWTFKTQSYNNTHLLGLPIESGIRVKLSHYIVNILDERKHKPTPDRERLTEEASRNIEKRINEEIAKIFAENEIKSVDEFENHPHKVFYQIRNKAGINSYFSDNAVEILNFLETPVATPMNKKTTIGDIMKPDSTLIRLGKLKVNKINALLKHVPNAIIFRVTNDNIHDMVYDPKFNVIDGDEYLEKHNIDTKQKLTGNHTVIVRQIEWEGQYSSWGYPSSRAKNTKIFSDDMDENMIRTTDEQARVLIEIMQLVNTPYSVVKNTKKLTKGTLHADFVKSAGLTTVWTNKGAMKLNEIDMTRKVCVVKCADVQAVSKIKTGRKLLIAHYDNEEIFKTLAFLEEYGVKYVFDSGSSRAGSLWKFMSLDKKIDEYDIPSVRSSDRRVESMLHIITTIQSIKDEQINRIFFRLLRRDGNMDKVIEEMTSLDQRITELTNGGK